MADGDIAVAAEGFLARLWVENRKMELYEKPFIRNKITDELIRTRRVNLESDISLGWKNLSALLANGRLPL